MSDSVRPGVSVSESGVRSVESGSGVRPAEALIVVDVQSAFFEGEEAVPHAAAVQERLEDLVGRARAAGALIVHLQNDGAPGTSDEPGTKGWELHLPVIPGPREVVIRKTEDDGFHETPLGDLLTGAGVRSLVVCGVMSEMCVLATARTALEREYRVVLPHDAHGTYDVPPAPGETDGVPAAMASRVAEWALGDEVEIVAYAKDVPFEGVSGPA
ncbi:MULTISPECIES: cysteine hydrolase family protein [Streptomyces]|uniref:Cysteine hydrolase n=2 Tax=Streptomyces rimosus subsp. rimosus TaxID=132474 RepID=A0A8A1UNW6_STRR1|nr:MULTISPECIES: cysteine hydrolase family protein [Streptomyces]MYT48221.1 isochorismatase family protein [Streptomyces sp. SID5471]QDA05765.1 cysteine hydrolase [Streptomyces rimosus]QEV77041.1 cysteine hydrolase [Streptomyces rimosus]QGY65284.1 isochorismatase family protein [Streptomyces rimosus R6-500]QST82213.1 cysteine hydrolase [Streptomyces rimosus subsp. rimosus ATCC 10970]